MRLPWAIDRPGQASGRSWWSRTVILVASTAALNVLFWLVVSRAASTHQHLTITLNGSSVSAGVGQHPAARWEGGLQGNGRLGIAITSREIADEAGVDHIVVKALRGGTVLVRDGISNGASAWTLPPSWRKDGHGFVTKGRAVLWSQHGVCGDCSIELDLVNSRGLDLFLRFTDDNKGLLLRWQDESLAWHATKNGELGGAHGIVHYTLSQDDLFGRFKARLASTLRDAYLDGWRFVWWYARAALPGLFVVILLGVVWRARYPFQIRWPRWRDKLVAGRRAISIVVGSIVTVAAVAIARPWRPDRVLSAATALLLISLAGCLIVLVGRELIHLRAVEAERYHRLRTGATAVAVLTICAAAAGYSAFAARVYLEGIPHVQDSASYLLAAKAIASGHLKVPIDPRLGPFFQLQVFFEHHDGYLYPLAPGLYFAGHPALLALGVLIHAPWVVNPISGGITLGLLFLLCRELFGTSTGILAITLGAISPFARFQSASMMSHTSALLFVTAALLFLIYWFKRRRPVYALCMGAALGALLNIRPFDAAVLGAYLGLVLLVRLRSVGWRAMLRMGGVAAAAFTPFVLLILCQLAAIGATLHPAAQQLLQWGPQNFDATHLRLVDLNYHLFGWPVVPGLPPGLTVGVLLVALLVMPKTRADWFIVGWAFLYPAGYAITNWHANMFGPRYWYCSLGGQLVLVARLLQLLPSLVTRLSRILWPPGKTRRWHWIPVTVGAMPMLLVAGPLLLGTINTFHTRFREMYSGGYNGFRAAPLRLLAEHGVTRGLIFFDQLPEWQDLVTGIASNDISFAGDLIFARHIEGRDHELIKARPGRQPYLITWNGTELELGRLRLDPVSSEVTLIPMPAKHDDLHVIGRSIIYLGIAMPGGAGLVGGLATDRRGDLYIVDSADHEVLVFDAGGILRRRLSASYSFGPEAINAGRGIAVDADGNVYVANVDPPGVVRLNADGTFAWRARQSPDGKQSLTGPIGIAMLPDGDLVVTNMNPPDLHVLRRDGTFVGYYAHGAARAELRRPISVAVGPNRHLYVCDAELKALLEIDKDGRAVRRWPFPVNPDRPFLSYVAVDQRGHAYVSDFNGFALYHVRPDKPEVEVIGAAGTLGGLSGVATRDGEVLVIQSHSNKVLRLPVP